VLDDSSYAALKSLVADRLREPRYAYAHLGGGVNIDRDKHVAVDELAAAPGPPS